MPLDNVATEDKGAIMFKYDDSGKMNKDIIIQLNQPYYIGSLRIQFWKEGKSTPFSVQTSLDMQNWSVAVDKRIEDLDASPVFHFIPRLVVFVRIFGTAKVIIEFKK